MRRFVITVLVLALSMASLGAQAPLKGKILKLDFASNVAERGGSDFSVSLKGISMDSKVSLLTLERVIDAAAEDKNIAMIYLKPDNYASGYAAAEEIRASLQRFRESGKPVVSYSTGFDTKSYYLASVADKVVLNPSGEGSLVGLASSLLFYKDLLDTLGVNVQLIRHGKFKSAGEPYIRNDISPANREQYETMLGTIWRSTMTQAAESRGKDLAYIDDLAENLKLDRAQTWLDAGLVDTLYYKNQMEDYLCGLFDVKKTEMLNVVDIEDYISKLKKGPAKAKIAVIFANGSIGAGDDVDGIKFAHEIAKARADSSVKAIVWRVNSPGGQVLSSDLIRREIDMARKVKPVIASYGDYAASGGYWISSSSDRIFTDRTTLTGSIGVFGMIPAVGDAIHKNLKVNPVSVGTHSHSDMMQGMRVFTDEERDWMQANIDSVYEQFVSLVAESRGLETAAVDSIAQGRVWAGADAINIGLVDEFGTALDAVKYAADKVGLKKYRIVYYPEKKSQSLMQMLKGSKDDDAPLVSVDLPETIQGPVQTFIEAGKIVGDLDRPSIQARMPYVIDIR